MSSPVPNPFEIRTVTAGPDLEDVRTLLREYNTHLRRVIDSALLEHRESELAYLPASFIPPLGALLLASAARGSIGSASSESRPLACAALRPLKLPNERSAAEFCRLWVTPAARGHALGWRLLQTAIHLARTAGHTVLVLNSVASVMQSAQAIYARAGFIPTLPYKHVAIPGIEFFRLDLTP